MKSTINFYRILLGFLLGYANKKTLLQAYAELQEPITLLKNDENPLDEGYETFHRASEQTRMDRVARITEAIIQDLGQAVITDPEASEFFLAWCEHMIPDGVTYRCHHSKGTTGGPDELIVTNRGAEYPRLEFKP